MNNPIYIFMIYFSNRVKSFYAVHLLTLFKTHKKKIIIIMSALYYSRLKRTTICMFHEHPYSTVAVL